MINPSSKYRSRSEIGDLITLNNKWWEHRWQRVLKLLHSSMKEKKKCAQVCDTRQRFYCQDRFFRDHAKQGSPSPVADFLPKNVKQQKVSGTLKSKSNRSKVMQSQNCRARYVQLKGQNWLPESDWFWLKHTYVCLLSKALFFSVCGALRCKVLLSTCCRAMT